MEPSIMELPNAKEDAAVFNASNEVWYWQKESEEDPARLTWEKYPEDLQRKIEKSFASFHNYVSVKFVAEGRNYTIFPLGCVQINGMTGLSRPIKKMICETSNELRWHWQSNNSKWKAYPDEISYMIDDARDKLQQSQIVEYEKDGKIHSIDLSEMTDTDTISNRSSKIVRRRL